MTSVLIYLIVLKIKKLMFNILEFMFSDYSFLIGCLFWPLWSAFILGLFGRFLGNYLAGRFAVFSLFVTASLAIVAFILIGLSQSKVIVPLFLCFKIL